MNPTKAALTKLKTKVQRTGNKKAKIKAKLKLVFTPTGGSAATQVIGGQAQALAGGSLAVAGDLAS